MKYQIVMVEWVDAEGDSGWSEVRDEILADIEPVFSIGWLIHENNKRLILASSLRAESDEVSGREYIPIGMVVRRVTLWHPDEKKSWKEIWDSGFGKPELL